MLAEMRVIMASVLVIEMAIMLAFICMHCLQRVIISMLYIHDTSSCMAVDVNSSIGRWAVGLFIIGMTQDLFDVLRTAFLIAVHWVLGGIQNMDTGVEQHRVRRYSLISHITMMLANSKLNLTPMS